MRKVTKSPVPTVKSKKHSKKPTKPKPVTKLSHVPISPQSLCEILGAYLNNMHNNEGRSIPGYAVAVQGQDGAVHSTTNIVRAIDEARLYITAFSGLIHRTHEGIAPELFEDRIPRVERLDR